MTTLKHIGLIEYRQGSGGYQLDANSLLNGYEVKKIYFSHPTSEKRNLYPNAEIVPSQDAILQDQTIDLILLSAPEENHMELVAQALNAGKQIRIV